MRFNRGKHKYGATRTADGFASRLERAVYYKLKDREILGEIKDIKRQQVVRLADGAVNWKLDFSFVDVASGRLMYVEAKGFPDASYLIKLRLYKFNPPARLEIWKGTWRRPFLAEVIECNK